MCFSLLTSVCKYFEKKTKRKERQEKERQEKKKKKKKETFAYYDEDWESKEIKVNL